MLNFYYAEKKKKQPAPTYYFQLQIKFLKYICLSHLSNSPHLRLKLQLVNHEKKIVYSIFCFCISIYFIDKIKQKKRQA